MRFLCFLNLACYIPLLAPFANAIETEYVSPFPPLNYIKKRPELIIPGSHDDNGFAPLKGGFKASKSYQRPQYVKFLRRAFIYNFHYKAALGIHYPHQIIFSNSTLTISPTSIKVKLTNFNSSNTNELAVALISPNLSLLDKADKIFEITDFLRKFTDSGAIVFNFIKAPAIKNTYQWTTIDDYILKTLIQKFPPPSQTDEMKEGTIFVIGEFFKWQRQVQTFCKGFYSENGGNIGKLSLVPHYFQEYLQDRLHIQKRDAAKYSKQMNMEVLHTFLLSPFENSDYVDFVFNQFVAYGFIPEALKSQYQEAMGL